jgi:DNA invertase Pin-like site-specific DNA recombinase
MIVKAYSYIRFSTPEQIKGDSLRRQEEVSKEYADRHGLELDETLRDIGISAFKGRNRTDGALGEFLQLVQEGKIPEGSFLLVESLDRLSRDKVMNALSLFTQIINGGITIVTLQDSQTYSKASIDANWSQLIISLAVMARAHDESAAKSKRLSAAWENKRRNLDQRTLTARCPEWLRLAADKQSFEVIPERVEIVRRVFQAAANGQGKHKIAGGLNQAGIPAFRGKQGWHASSIQKMIESEAVLGQFQPHRKVNGKRSPEGDVAKGYYPAIIDEALFYRAQAGRDQRRVNGAGRKGKGYPNVFSGICRCAECGSGMVYLDKGKPPRGGRYLVCSKARRGLCQNRTHYRYDGLEQDMLVLATEVNLASIIGQQENATQSDLSLLETQITAKRGKLDALVAAMDGDDSVEPLVEKVKKLNVELVQMKGRREELAKAAKVGPSVSGNRFEEIALALAALNWAKDDERFAIRAWLASEFKRTIEGIQFVQHEARIIVQMKTTRTVRVAYVWVNGQFHRGYIKKPGQDHLDLTLDEIRMLFRRGSFDPVVPVA